MTGTTNVDRKNETTEVTTSYEEFDSTYEMNIIGWDIEGQKLEEKTSAKIEGNKTREKKYGYVSTKAYPGGYKEKNKEADITK